MALKMRDLIISGLSILRRENDHQIEAPYGASMMRREDGTQIEAHYGASNALAC